MSRGVKAMSANHLIFSVDGVRYQFSVSDEWVGIVKTEEIHDAPLTTSIGLPREAWDEMVEYVRRERDVCYS